MGGFVTAGSARYLPVEMLLSLLLACSRPTLQVRPYALEDDAIGVPVAPLFEPTSAERRAPPSLGGLRRVDAGIVPGCPTEQDGTVSHCLWRRAIWAYHVWSSGLTDTLIVSGNAVYSRYTEAGALKAALVALGVPASAVIEEPQALHTDENIAYSLRIVDRRGFDSVAVVSDAVQTVGTCDMVTNWTKGRIGCLAAPMDYAVVHARMGMGLPAVTLQPVSEWEPLDVREKKIAEQLGTPVRGNSMLIYMKGSVLGALGLSQPPPLLPIPPEPGPD